MSNRKKVFFSSDWHIGHKNVLKFSNRPFKDIEHMHRVLINNYNHSVGDQGVCYFLGDHGLCGSDTMRKVMKQLKGIKVLVLGNHDKGINTMYNMGFDVVLHGATLQIANQRVTMSHCPLFGVYRENTEGMRGGRKNENWHGEHLEKRRIFTTPDYGQFHLHGHIHSPNSGKSQKILDRQYDVGVDANNYTPVSISTIESWISKTIQNKKTCDFCDKPCGNTWCSTKV
jgi:calcineurin-like phosphoesterase family protein